MLDLLKIKIVRDLNNKPKFAGPTIGLIGSSSKHPNNYQKLNTVDDLRNFYGSTNDYEKYRYVLSENNKKQALIYSNFELMRAYKLTFNIID